MKIEELLQKENYAIELWELRGLTPSDSSIIEELEMATHLFLKRLKVINEDDSSDKTKELSMINDLVDDLPWYAFDTEEKEFLVDVLAPAIKSMGFDPWDIF